MLWQNGLTLFVVHTKLPARDNGTGSLPPWHFDRAPLPGLPTGLLSPCIALTNFTVSQKKQGLLRDDHLL